MANIAIKQTIQFKRGTTEKLNAWTGIPAVGEPIYDISQKVLKIGDGIHRYADLPICGGNGPQQIIFDTYLQFPSIGSENILYVAKDLNKAYTWDVTNNRYQILEAEINMVDGGGADSFN